MRKLLLALGGTASLAFAAAIPTAASAATWSEIPSGTTHDITAIAYQGGDRAWFGTANGEIFKRTGGTFSRVFTGDGVSVIRSIAFQSGAGQVGFAVGNNGLVLRTANGGTTWAPVAGITGGSKTSSTDCSVNQTLGDLDSVRFAGDARVWIAGTGSQVFRTVDGATTANVGQNAAGFTYINRNADNSCRVDRDIDDVFPVPGGDAAYLISRDFGRVFFTSNALTSTATVRPADAGNGFDKRRRVAGDPDNPNRMWAVIPGGGGSYFNATTDGWSTESDIVIGNRNQTSSDLSNLGDIAYAGGTVVIAGTAGQIVESIDGRTFFIDAAQGAIQTADWAAVGLAGANDGLIGGTGGKLAQTANASVMPDVVAPAGAIQGPTTAIAGKPTAYTAVVSDNAGGSGIDPASFAWTTSGVPLATGNPATLTFPTAGTYLVTVTFKDLAGNQGTATQTVTVLGAGTILPGTINPTPTKTVTVTGGSVKLSGPKTCVAPGGAFTATLAFTRSKKKGAKKVKVTRVDFSIDKKVVFKDKKAPFSRRLTVGALAAGTKHTLKARAYIKVRRGKVPTKSVSVSFTVCSL